MESVVEWIWGAGVWKFGWARCIRWTGRLSWLLPGSGSNSLVWWWETLFNGGKRIDWAWLSHTVLIPEVSILDYIILYHYMAIKLYIYIYTQHYTTSCIIAEPLQSPLRLVKWIPTNDSGTFGRPGAANWAWPHLLERSPRGFGGTLIFLCCTNPLKNHWKLGFSTCSLAMSPSNNDWTPRKPCRITSTSRNQKQTVQFSLKSQQKKHHLPNIYTGKAGASHTPTFPQVSPNPPEPQEAPPPVRHHRSSAARHPRGPGGDGCAPSGSRSAASSRSFLALGDREGWKKNTCGKNGEGNAQKKKMDDTKVLVWLLEMIHLDWSASTLNGTTPQSFDIFSRMESTLHTRCHGKSGRRLASSLCLRSHTASYTQMWVKVSDLHLKTSQDMTGWLLQHCVLVLSSETGGTSRVWAKFISACPSPDRWMTANRAVSEQD